MRAWFDILMLPLFLTVLLINFHWITDSFILELRTEKFLFNASRTSEALATNLLLNNCSTPTHHLIDFPHTSGTYFVFRAALVKGVPELLAVGNQKG